VQELKEDG
jgi:hypothetical protein